MNLLIDIGNTRIKWAVHDGNDLAHQHAAVHAHWTERECNAQFSMLPPPARVFVSNVGGERIAEVIRSVVRARWDIEPTFVESTAEAAGVRNAYPDVWRLGVDRWVGIIGAYWAYRQALCVVSIGTAATIDGVDASGRHLGGLIVPGPDLMVSSLLTNTSGIAERAATGSVDEGMFADNTLGAIHQGSLHAIAALAERATAAMQTQLGETPRLILTGGRSDDVGRFIVREHVLISDLVLRGLAVLAQTQES
jgi:type III pantothenate kinase